MTRPYLTSDPAACTHGYRMHECPTCNKFIEKRTWYNSATLAEKEWWLRWIRPQ